MGGSCLELNNRKREMASLGFLSSVKDHDGSGGSASVATPLAVHPGVRLSNTFGVDGWLAFELHNRI